MRILYVLISSLFLCLQLHSQSAQPKTESSLPEGYSTGGLFLEQDYLIEPFGLDEDRNYTMGVGFYYASDRLRRSWLTAPVRWLNSKLFISKLHQSLEKDDDRPFLYSLMVANGSFTPDNLSSSAISRNDRPYGNVTYLQQNLTRIEASGFRKHSSSFIVGILGTYVSRAVQTEVHSWSNENDTKDPRTPRGWHHQISTGGEPTFMLTRSTETLLTRKALEQQRIGTLGAEVKHGWKYSVGYYTSAQYGLTMRLGWLDPNNWISEVNPLGNSNKITQSDFKLKPEFYFLASGRPVFMLYNALLNGQFRRSDHTISFQSTRHFLFEWDLGLGGRIPISKSTVLDARWRALSGRTAEFRLPGWDGRTHRWGGIDLTITHFKTKTK